MAAVMEARSQAGYALARDEGEAFWLLGMLQTVKIGKADTDGRFGMLEIVVPEGLGSPWHAHPEEDERFYILDGPLTLWGGDPNPDPTPGGFAVGPKARPQPFQGSPP